MLGRAVAVGDGLGLGVGMGTEVAVGARYITGVKGPAVFVDGVLLHADAISKVRPAK